MSAKQATQAGRAPGVEEDWVDRAVLRWAGEIPELEPATEALVERISKISKLLRRNMPAETAVGSALTARGLGAPRRELSLAGASLGPPRPGAPGRPVRPVAGGHDRPARPPQCGRLPAARP